LRVEPVEFVEAFGNLLVAKTTLRAEDTGGSTDPVFMDKNVAGLLPP